MKYDEALFSQIVSVGKKIFSDTAFTCSQIALSQRDIDIFHQFLLKCSSIHSNPNWNGEMQQHVQLAESITLQLLMDVDLNEELRLLTQYQTLSHDVGRLISHYIIDSELAGSALLKEMNFLAEFISIHFGWDYYTSDSFSPDLGCARNRIVLLSDLFGKPGSNGESVRSVQDVVTSVTTIKTRYKPSDSDAFKISAPQAIERCLQAMEYSIELLGKKGIDFKKVLANIPKVQLAK